MGCVINAGVLGECAHNFGGLKELYLGNYDDLEGLEYNADGHVTGATMASGATIYEFQFVKNTGQALEELVKAGATSYINQTLNFQLKAITQAKKSILDDLSLAPIFAIVKRADNSYWVYGEPAKSAGLEAETLTIDTGAAQGDESGATISLVGGSLAYASTVEDSVVEAMLSA